MRLADLGRAQQERARGLIKGGPPQPFIPVVPGLPGQSTEKETDEAISRLARLLQQQPPTTQEKPPERPLPRVLGPAADDHYVHVVGHTDNVGTLPSNMTLSKQRPEAVVKALVNDHRIAAARLIANGVGPRATEIGERIAGQ